MNDSPQDSIRPLLSKIHDFLIGEAYPFEHEFLHRPFRELVPALTAKREQVKALGLWSPHLPEEYGGPGLKLSEFAHISEELGRTPIGHYLFNCQAPDIGNMEVLMSHTTPEQRDLYLWPLIRGEVRSCFSMTEPEHPGSNPTWMSTLAVKEGDDYVINGHKWFTSSAEGASFAIVMAVTDPTASNKYKRASQIIVPTSTPGFRIVRNVSVMGDEGSDYASHAEVRYENCRVPQSNLLGREGEGFTIAQERLGPGVMQSKSLSKEQQEVAMAAWQKKFEAGPRGVMVYHPTGATPFSMSQLAGELLSDIVAGIIVAFVLAMALGSLRTWAARVGFVVLLGLLPWIIVDFSYLNWYGFPVAYEVGQLLDQVPGMFLAGIVLAFIFRRDVPQGA